MTERNLYLIAGPNGAGKTTASFTLLPEVLQCRQFVNADEIARGLSPFAPESVAVQAGRIMLARVYQLLQEGADFALETTLATRSYGRLIEQAQAQDYVVSLLFFWLPSADMAVQRVIRRVAEGGHAIPEPTIRRRYESGLLSFFNQYRKAVDFWTFADNTNFTPVTIAAGTADTVIDVQNQPLWEALRSQYETV